MGHIDIWSKLEDLSDRQDWWVEGIVNAYMLLGPIMAVLSLMPTRRAKDIQDTIWDLHFTRQDIEFYDDWVCELGQSKLQKNKRLMELATLVHKEACYKNLYNNNRYFWMPRK